MNLSYTSILGDEQILPEIGKFYMLQCLDNEDELREEFTRKLAQKILNYLVVSCAGEMRYCRSETVGNITDLGGDAQALVLTVMKEPKYGSRDFLWCVGYNLAQEFGYPRITQALFEIFDTFEWKSSSVGVDVLSWSSRSVGGVKWANIAKVANQFATGEFNDIIFVDGVMSIVHNSNWAFNKYYNKDCNYLGLQSLLDYKRDATRESIFKLLTDLGIKEKQLETATITIDGLSARVVIHEDQTTNFGQLVAKPPANAEDNDNAARTDEEVTPFSITIESIELTDGTLRFADYSLPLPFSTSIHTLSGQISTLNSTSDQPARVDLEGQVAEYGLARVEGAVDAWNPSRASNLQLTFRNLQIPEYSPYTVHFAGRKIAGGTMDLDLDYTVESRQLDGQNNLVLHDLKLGEKMASSNAMDLPLNLAIALLQDSDGVIDLNLPVTGNVGDPEFDFNQVIRQALGDAIMSVITAPFSFLANLVGADSENLGQVEFAKGRTDLLPPQRERIAKLRAALNQRPALALELAGPFSRNFDGPALQRKKAIEALRQRLAEADRDVADPSLTAESNQSIVETMFSSYYPETDLEAVQARFTEKQNESSGGAELDALVYRNHLAERVITAQSITDPELEAIANARASAVRDALVDPNADVSIAPDRVRLLNPKEIDSVDGERIAMKVGITAN
ncbi:hypothetical protein LCGC14_0778640 [marine sediment metagenome]|uniref:DUF748 domain-containing protein n=1 Tax=marine sediment metagenome TaxID=412755 RepID=A0A0F9QG20_9ZZZZ